MIKIFYKDKNISLNVPAEIFADIFPDKFSIICAGGGIVYNDNYEILIIKRNGIWDFPKGKIEDNENIDKTAIREVSEECGISIKDLKIINNSPLYSFYIYENDGNFIFKKITWFEMKFTNNYELTPQIEEGISELKWIKKEELEKYMKDSFPSIKELTASVGQRR